MGRWRLPRPSRDLKILKSRAGPCQRDFRKQQPRLDAVIGGAKNRHRAEAGIEFGEVACAKAFAVVEDFQVPRGPLQAGLPKNTSRLDAAIGARENRYHVEAGLVFGEVAFARALAGLVNFQVPRWPLSA